VTTPASQRRDLAVELLHRKVNDQMVRRTPTSLADPEAMERVDRDNTAALKRIVAEHGWPGRTLVGEEAAEAAWLLAQHADADQDFQLHALTLLEEAVRQGEATAKQLAYLTDRCLMHAGRPQLYGTQYACGPDGARPHPVVDPDRLDERRAAVGLGPYAEYDAAIRLHYLSLPI
jgi:hypothetical protein